MRRWRTQAATSCGMYNSATAMTSSAAQAGASRAQPLRAQPSQHRRVGERQIYTQPKRRGENRAEQHDQKRSRCELPRHDHESQPPGWRAAHEGRAETATGCTSHGAHHRRDRGAAIQHAARVPLPRGVHRHPPPADAAQRRRPLQVRARAEECGACNDAARRPSQRMPPAPAIVVARAANRQEQQEEELQADAGAQPGARGCPLPRRQARQASVNGSIRTKVISLVTATVVNGAARRSTRPTTESRP